MRRTLAVALIVVAGLFMLLAPNVLAQEPCTADFNCDQNVDATDVDTFLSQFGRNPFNDPCPDCYDSPCPCTTQGDTCLYGMVDCGDKCVDPMTDEDYCGANEECLGGTLCIAGESCESGICILNCPSGLIECGGQCVNPMTDENFCGASGDCVGGNAGTACGAGEICAGGVCTLTCPPGLTNCTGSCVDTTTDESNCGDCGIPCDSEEVCLGGNCEIVGGGAYQAAVEKTGQTTSYATGDDGDLEKGVIWPNPRFTDTLDGTITDNLTGLIWLKDANCFGTRLWNNALSDSNGLASGSCELTDGSQAGDWRLPNSNELASLVHKEYYAPSVPDTAGTGQWSQGDPFNNVQFNSYWTSTTNAFGSAYAWYVYMFNGDVVSYDKASDYYVWPVRDPL